MDTGAADSLVSAERSRAFAAALWFRVAAVLVIGLTAGHGHSLPTWMRGGFVTVARPLLGYNLVSLLARTRLERFLALLLRSRNLLRREWDPEQVRNELQWLWRGLGYLQIELNHLVETLSQTDSPTDWKLTAIAHKEIELAAALTGGRWVLMLSCEKPLYLSARRRDALRHFLAEALMNTWKHLGQVAGSLDLHREGDEISLGLSDSGCGFDSQGLSAKEGLGLRSLSLRARELGGQLELDSRPGQGCRLRLRFPTNLAFHGASQ